MTYRTILVASVLASMMVPNAGWARHYKVDADHTSVTFRVRHLFSAVKGRFDKFEGEIEFDPAKPDASKVIGNIDVASINTNVAERDKHLRSKDFFDVANFPKITFQSTGVTDLDAAKKSGKMQAELTIHGVEKPVVLEVSFLGEIKDPWGNTKAGFTANTTINRKDFGLTWNQALETGGALVGDDVQIEIDAEGLAQ
ncbi:MAG: YceI family protein [Deltaproteobacteria bacterium]|nr:YceI family protein [Deltaproteobacteria bacterium]